MPAVSPGRAAQRRTCPDEDDTAGRAGTVGGGTGGGASGHRVRGRDSGREPISRSVVPGLLQTEDYARSVIRAGQPRILPEELERKVGSRLERQVIFARDSGRPMYWAVIHEGVLRHVVGSPEIMHAQLDRLVEVADSPDVILQVLPYSASDHPGTDGPILVFDFASALSSGYTECKGGGMIVEQREQVSGLVTTMSLIRAAALSPRESRKYIVKIRDEIT